MNQRIKTGSYFEDEQISNHRNTQNGSLSSLEAENEAREHALREKITALKNVSIQIRDEVQTQTVLLRNMDSVFETTGARLRSARQWLGRLVRSGQAGACHQLTLYCTLGGFALLVFLVCWLLLKFS